MTGMTAVSLVVVPDKPAMKPGPDTGTERDD